MLNCQYCLTNPCACDGATSEKYFIHTPDRYVTVLPLDKTKPCADCGGEATYTFQEPEPDGHIWNWCGVCDFF